MDHTSFKAGDVVCMVKLDYVLDTRLKQVSVWKREKWTCRSRVWFLGLQSSTFGIASHNSVISTGIFYYANIQSFIVYRSSVIEVSLDYTLVSALCA